MLYIARCGGIVDLVKPSLVNVILPTEVGPVLPEGQVYVNTVSCTDSVLLYVLLYTCLITHPQDNLGCGTDNHYT